MENIVTAYSRQKTSFINWTVFNINPYDPTFWKCILILFWAELLFLLRINRWIVELDKFFYSRNVLTIFEEELIEDRICWKIKLFWGTYLIDDIIKFVISISVINSSEFEKISFFFIGLVESINSNIFHYIINIVIIKVVPEALIRIPY